MLENVTGPGAAFHESSETTVCRVPSSYSICSLKIIFGAPYDPANLLYRSRGMLKNPLPSIAPTALAPLPKPVAHVERNVLRLLIELGPGRIEEVVARLLAVEKQLELAQSADIGRRPPHGLVDRELAAQQRQLVPPERLGCPGSGCRDPCRTCR